MNSLHNKANSPPSLTFKKASQLILQPDVYIPPKPTLPKLNTTTWARPVAMAPPRQSQPGVPPLITHVVGTMTSGAVYSPSLYSPDSAFPTDGNLAHLPLPPSGAVITQQQVSTACSSSPSLSPPLTPPPPTQQQPVELDATTREGRRPATTTAQVPVELPADDETAARGRSRSYSPPTAAVVPAKGQEQHPRRHTASLAVPTPLPHPLRSNPPNPDPKPARRPKHVSASFPVMAPQTSPLKPHAAARPKRVSASFQIVALQLDSGLQGHRPPPQQSQSQQQQPQQPPAPQQHHPSKPSRRRDSAVVAPLQIQRRPRVTKKPSVELHPSPLRIGTVPTTSTSSSGAKKGEEEACCWLDALDSGARNLRLMKPLPGLPAAVSAG